MFSKPGNSVFLLSSFCAFLHVSTYLLMSYMRSGTDQRSLILSQRVYEFTGVTHQSMDEGWMIPKQLHLLKPHISPGEEDSG